MAVGIKKWVFLWVFVSGACSAPQDPCQGGQVIEIRGGTCYSALQLSDQSTRNFSLHEADFNGDSFLDVIVGGTLWINDKEEQFTPTDTGESFLAVADLNGDTLPDLISSQGVRINLGNAQFGAHQAIPIELKGAQGSIPEIGDLDNDSDLDFVVMNFPTQGAVLLNDGLATFSQTQSFSFPAEAPFTKKLGDFNGDLFSDLLISDEGQLLLLLNDRLGQLTFQQFLPPPAVTHLQTADLNQDGLLDLLTGFNFQFLLNQTQDPSTPQFQIFTPQPILPIISTASADFNQDNFPDVVASQAFEPNLLLYLTTGPALFQEPLAIPLDKEPLQVVVRDLNNDSIPDLVASHSSPFSATVLLSQP